MKRIIFSLLCVLIPLSNHAMRSPTEVPVFLKYLNPKIRALHNRIFTVYVDVEKQPTLADAIARFKDNERYETEIKIETTFDGFYIPTSKWTQYRITSDDRGNAFLRTISKDSISRENPIVIWFPQE